jgi:hypothetical protein
MKLRSRIPWGWQARADYTATFAKPDPDKLVGPPGVRAQDDLVTVFKKSALLAGFEANGLLSSGSKAASPSSLDLTDIIVGH